MEVIYWQIVVALTTAGAYLKKGRRWGMGVAIFWSMWTLIMIFTMPLTFIQLGVTWGSFYLVDTLTKQKRQIVKLQQAIKGYSTSMQVEVHRADDEGKVHHLKDKNHYSFLLSSIRNSKESLLVLSGWISSSVVNRQFLRELDSALGRGVNIYLGFGYEDSKGTHEMTANAKKAEKMIMNLANQQSNGSGQLYIGRFNNHQKIIIRDQKQVVCGSHNWLSNKTFKNQERSFIVNDSKLAKAAYEEMSAIIVEHSIQSQHM